MRNTFKATEELIGKYINRYLWTDVQPVGKIIGIKSKSIVIVQRVVAGENLNKMEFIAGGFSAHCPNNHSQKYEFFETEEVFEVRLSKQYLKQCRIDRLPHNFYDYNF